MYEQYTDKQIMEMLIPKLSKVIPGLNWDEYSKHPDNYFYIWARLISVIYKSAYIRGQLGRSFIVEGKKADEKKVKKSVNTFKVGNKVKFLGLNVEDEEALNNRRSYPPVNTVGKIVKLDSDYCFVRWPKGIVSGDEVRACRNIYLEKVTEHWVPANKDNVKTGSKVKMINDKIHNEYPRWFPVVGTVGAIINASNTSSYIQWPSGTTSENDRWFCSLDWLEVLLCE